MTPESLAVIYLAAAKWVTYLALFGLTGASVARLVIVSPADGKLDADPGLDAAVDRRLLVVGAGSAGALVVATAARLYAQTYSVFGLDEPVTLGLVRVIALESRWGDFWLPQAFTAAGGLVAIGWAAARPHPGWRATAVVVVLAWVTLPMTGHAVTLGTHLPWFVQIGHGLAAAAWLGTLAAVLAGAAVVAGMADADRRVSLLIERFSPMAVGAVSVVLATGGATTWFYVDRIGQLWTTPWGLALLVKIGLVAATGAVGAYNWRRLRPRLGHEAGTRALFRSARVELVLGVVLLAITAVLVHLAMPYELE